jgi:hypothetical protein
MASRHGRLAEPHGVGVAELAAALGVLRRAETGESRSAERQHIVNHPRPARPSAGR